MTPATPDQAGEIAGFLSRAPEFAMFPLANLLSHGMVGGHPHAMRFWLLRDASGITDALGLTDAGMVLPALRPEMARLARGALSALPLIGIIGPAAQARALEKALSLADAPKSLNKDEPHFALDLKDLAIPAGPGLLRAMAQAPATVIQGWMADYHLNALHTPPDQVPERVQSWYNEAVRARTHPVLMHGDRPLAMTGFNAQLDQIVQIGGVYTPPPLRGRGHARRAVALHLAGARASGVRRATLFSASEAAARAYRSIGFRQIGAYSLILFNGPQETR